MPQWVRHSGSEAGWRGSDRYALPPYVGAPRQRVSIGVVVTLVTGLGAVGLAGFLCFSTVVSGPADRSRPAASDAPVGTTPAVAPPSPTPSNAPAGPTGDGSDVLTASPLYSSGEMTRVRCEAPHLDADNDASMERFLQEMTDCLDRAWSEQFAKSGLDYQQPNRVYWSTGGQSPCGDYPSAGTAAFYCQANNALYLGVDDIVRRSNSSDDPEVYTFLLSHEYAHHVQGQAGILQRFHQARGAADDTSQRNLLTRRSELQANCLGGAFLGAVSGSFPIGQDEQENILGDAERRGDYDSGERTHGSPEHGRMWTEHGMDRRDPAACNTWSARQDVVE